MRASAWNGGEGPREYRFDFKPKQPGEYEPGVTGTGRTARKLRRAGAEPKSTAEGSRPEQHAWGCC